MGVSDGHIGKNRFYVIVGWWNRYVGTVYLCFMVLRRQSTTVNDNHGGDMDNDISQCSHCLCMTHTIDGKCGKCGGKKGWGEDNDETDDGGEEFHRSEDYKL